MQGTRKSYKDIKKLAQTVEVCANSDHSRMWVMVDGKMVLHVHMCDKLILPQPMVDWNAKD
jgi:hypothetical protein